jgi:hypothetical protein
MCLYEDTQGKKRVETKNTNLLYRFGTLVGDIMPVYPELQIVSRRAYLLPCAQLLLMLYCQSNGVSACKRSKDG